MCSTAKLTGKCPNYRHFPQTKPDTNPNLSMPSAAWSFLWPCKEGRTKHLFLWYLSPCRSLSVPLLNNAFLFTSALKEHNNMYWNSLPTVKQLRALAHQLCRDKCIPQHEGQQCEKRLIVGQHNCNASIYSSSDRWHPFRQYLLKSFGKLVVNRGGRMV